MCGGGGSEYYAGKGTRLYKSCTVRGSDIALIIDWAAKRAGLEFEQQTQPDGKTGVPEKALGIVGECAEEGAADALKELGCMSVYDVANKEETK